MSPALRPSLAAALGALLLAPRAAAAGSSDLFGEGSRSASLAQADVAGCDPTVAAYAGPTRAAEPGARASLSYGHAWTRLRFQGVQAPVPDIAGADIALQLGGRVGDRLSVGAAVAVHLPDRGLGRVAIRAASEPTFPRYESAAQQTSVDAVAAVRFGGLSLAAGASLSAAAAATAEVNLPQDARGPHADGALDSTIKYHPSPVLGASFTTPWLTAAARLRGASSVPVSLDTISNVAFRDNPLNGATTVHLAGEAGYQPLSVDLALAAAPLPALRTFAALSYARWRSAPGPAASISVDLALGSNPSELKTSFAGPRLRDTLSPRLGLELGPPAGPWALRAGYAYLPSPLAEVGGFLTPVDPPRHVIATGVGWVFDDLLGVRVALDAHLALHQLVTQTAQKADLALPWARYEGGGRLVQAGATITGGLR